MPSSRRTRRRNAGPFEASRSADVPAAVIRFTPDPRATDRKSRSASKARSSDSAGMRPVRSSSRTSRRDARLPASTCRWPPFSCRYTMTRPEFEPTSITATGGRGRARAAGRLGTLRMAALSLPENDEPRASVDGDGVKQAGGRRGLGGPA